MDDVPVRRRRGTALAGLATTLLLVAIVLGERDEPAVGLARGAALAIGILLAVAAIARAWTRPRALSPGGQARRRRPSRSAAVARTSSSL